MAGTGEAVPGPVSAEQHRSVASWLVPPSGSSLSTRSVPCSMRFTGRPRLIPDEDSTRCMTRSTAGTSWNRRRTQAQPGLGAAVSYTHLRAHETRHDIVCRLLLDKKK